MQVTIKITGNPQSVIQAGLERIKQQVNTAVQGAGIDCQALAKQACPVDTGRLRASIQYVSTGPSSCKIGTDVSYGPDIEYGHATRGHKSIVAPRPFLFPAYVKTKQTFRDELAAIPGISIKSWS